MIRSRQGDDESLWACPACRVDGRRRSLCDVLWPARYGPKGFGMTSIGVSVIHPRFFARRTERACRGTCYGAPELTMGDGIPVGNAGIERLNLDDWQQQQQEQHGEAVVVDVDSSRGTHGYKKSGPLVSFCRGDGNQSIDDQFDDGGGVAEISFECIFVTRYLFTWGLGVDRPCQL
jgi:hypothetical protein